MPPQYSAAGSHRRSIETIGVWVLFATLVISIFVFVPFVAIPFVGTKTFVLAAGAFATLVLYILARLGRGSVIFPSFTLVGVLWLPVIAYALSAIFSNVPFTNALWGSALELDTLGYMLIVTILGTLTALMLRRPEQYQSFMRVGAWVFGIFVTLQVLIAIVGQSFPNTISPAFSPVGSTEDVASLLGLGVIAILIFLREFNISQQMRRMSVVILAAALVLLAIAHSVLAWTLIALVSLGLFVEAILRRKTESADADFDKIMLMDETSLEVEEGTRSLAVPLVVLVVSIFFLFGGSLGDALASSLNMNAVNVRPSWQSTVSVAQQVYGTSPMFGSGPGTFGIEWLKYRDAALNATPLWNVDFTSGIGAIPTSFVTTGIVGGVAWAILFLFLIVSGFRTNIFRASQDTFVRHVAVLSFVGSFYLFVISLFSLPNPGILALAFVFTGLFISTTRFSVSGQQWGIIFARSPRLGFVVVFFLTIILLGSVVAAYSLVGRYVASAQITKANVAFSVGDLNAADAAVQNALFFTPTAAAYQIQASVASVRLDQIVSSTTMPVSTAQQAFQTTLSSGINAALTATRLAPSDYQSWIVLGNLYAKAVPLSVSGAYESAKTAYLKAQELSPTNPQIPFVLAQLEIAHKDIKAAKEALEAAITLKQDFTDAIFLFSKLEVQDGNVKEALAAALAAAYFTPNNPSILFQVGILSAAQGDYVSATNALADAVAANQEFANARYFLAAVYAKRGDMQNALAQMEAIANMSSSNAKVVAAELAALREGKNPFPQNLLSVSPAPVK